MAWQICGQCGRHNQEDSESCVSCGAALSETAETAEAPTGPRPAQTLSQSPVPVEVNIVKADIPFGDVLSLSWKFFGAGLIVGLAAVPIVFILMAIFLAIFFSMGAP